MKPLVVGNWKMELSHTGALNLARNLVTKKQKNDEVEVVLCPSYGSLAAVAEILQGSDFKVGAQDGYFEDEGAFTGAVSMKQLAELGCRYVIIGHSERRHFFSEDNQTVHKKIQAALRYGLIPILCVGETKEERQQGRGEHVVTEQLRSALLDMNDAPRLVVAYEPVWAIGAGKPAGLDMVLAMQNIILQTLKQVCPRNIQDVCTLLYGGSVNAEEVARYVGGDKMHGVLVGGASLQAQDFANIIQAVTQQ